MNLTRTIRRILLFGLVAAASANAGPIGYVLNFSGQFGKMDLTTGAFTPIGTGASANPAGGLGGVPGGPFYGADGNTGHLLRILANGTVIDVGNTGTGPGVGPNGISVLGSLTNGAVYALDFSNHLLSINTSTGGATSLGTLALPTQESQYDGNMVTSFNGNGTFLYYTLEIDAGPNATGPTLYRINPANLQIVSTPLTGLNSRLIGSGFVGGTLFGFTDFGEIYGINTGTGAASLLGTYDSGSTAANPGPPFTGVFGVVATPEPETVWLSVVGVAAILVGRRRARPVL